MAISYSVCDAHDHDAAVELLTAAFCHSDPIERALDITPDEFRLMAQLELEVALTNGLCLAARRGGELVGIAIAADVLAESVDSSDRITPKFAPISDIARRVHDAYLAQREWQPGSCLYVFMVAVRPDAAGQGIGQALIDATLHNAEKHGYVGAFSMATNLASMQAFARCDFRTLELLGYPGYRYRGEAVLASITDHPGIALMERASLADAQASADAGAAWQPAFKTDL
jgi:GNAT superfamily N-acetyltransferase